MKANELMVGDYVNYRGQIIKVTSLYDKGGSNEVGWSDRESVWVNGRCIESIPLEKKHLVKNGFKVRGGTDDMEYFFYDAYEVKVMFDDGRVIYEQDGKTPFTEIPPSIFLTIEFAEKSIAMPIEYVHELQQAMRIMGCDKTIEL